MTIPVTLSTISNLQDTTTAQTNINNNSAAITGGFSTALNVIGDQMKGNLDMNSNQILNLPAPAGANSPVRLQDVTSSSSIASVPPVGTSGANVGLLNANLSFSGNDTFSGNNTFSGTNSFATIAGTVTSNGSVYFKNGIPWADVKAWGALGNNSNNDTTAIQNAINFMNTTYGGGYVFFPPGEYVVSSTLTVKGGVILLGSGVNCTLIVGVAQDSTVINFDSSCANAGAENIYVLGYNNISATQDTVVVANGVRVNCRNCKFQLGRYALESGGGGAFFDTCSIMGLTGGVLSSGSNWFTACDFDGTATYAYNRQPYYAGGTNVGEDQIVSCDFSGNFTNSLVVTGAGGSGGAIVKIMNSVLSSPIVVNSSVWTSLIGCEISSTTITASAGVITVIGCYGFGGSTVVATSSGATKIVSGNFLIT